MEIYSKLYDVVVENCDNANCGFEYRKSTYLCDVGNHPQVIDVSKYGEMSNEEFFQAVFVAALKRLPEEKEVAPWIARYAQEKEVFQEAVLRYIMKSNAFALNQMKIINNPYFEQKRSLQYRLMGKLYWLTDKSALREFGKKLPQPIQKVIRKLFL